VLFGESAGVTLVLSALHVMRSQDIPLPGGVVAVSPITDLTLSSPSIDSPAGEDMLARPVLETPPQIAITFLDRLTAWPTALP
jgi:acetyl esterase/lipase